MSRRKLPDDQRRSVRVVTYLTAAEFDALLHLFGGSPSDALRAALREALRAMQFE